MTVLKNQLGDSNAQMQGTGPTSGPAGVHNDSPHKDANYPSDDTKGKDEK